METLGSLIDKFSIEKIREDKLSAKKNVTTEEVFLCRNKIEHLSKEVDAYISLAISGDIPMSDPKQKMYKNEEPSGVNFISVAEAMDHLMLANLTLWDLEDKRRNPRSSDATIRKICDNVASMNRVRNDCIDEINELFIDMLR